MFSRFFWIGVFGLVFISNSAFAQSSKPVKCPKFIAKLSDGTYLPSKGNYMCFSSEASAKKSGFIHANSSSVQPPLPPVNNSSFLPFDVIGQGRMVSGSFRLPKGNVRVIMYQDLATCGGRGVSMYFNFYHDGLYEGATSTQGGLGAVEEEVQFLNHTGNYVIDTFGSGPQAVGCKWRVHIKPV